MAGKLQNATSQNWETYEKNLKYAADVLKNENLLGVIEPINQYSVPNYFLSDFNKGMNHKHLLSTLLVFIVLIHIAFPTININKNS